jgi:hypothetical protein
MDASGLGGIMFPPVTAAIIFIAIKGIKTMMKQILTIKAVLVTLIGEFALWRIARLALLTGVSLGHSHVWKN